MIVASLVYVLASFAFMHVLPPNNSLSTKLLAGALWPVVLLTPYKKIHY